MLMINCLVSIIIPCYNCEKYIEDAIRSAVEQSYKNIEIIVVDDGSTDGSALCARKFDNIIIVSKENGGVSSARNHGLKIANGEFVIFLDADDRLDKDAVAIGLRCYSERPKASMIFGSNRVISHDGRQIALNMQNERIFSFKHVLMGTVPPPSQSMFRREMVIDVGVFLENLSMGEDFDLYLRLMKLSDGYCHGKLVADYRRHDQQTTRKSSSLLESMLSVIATHERVAGGTINADDFARARRKWKQYHGQYMWLQLGRSIGRREFHSAWDIAVIYLKHLPFTLIGTLQFIGDRFSQAATNALNRRPQGDGGNARSN